MGLLKTVLITIFTCLLTTTVTEFFRNVSWTDTAIMQEANDAVANAGSANEAVTQLIAKRRYALYRYLDSLTDLHSNNLQLSDLAKDLELDIVRKRFEAYSDANREWTEQYNKILSDIDFSLDHPLEIREVIHSIDISRFDCKKPLKAGMTAAGLNPYSLKLQFAVIDRCFRETRMDIDNLKSSLAGRARKLGEDGLENEILLRKKYLQDRALGDLYTHETTFRCYLRTRIEFFKSVRRNLLNRPVKARITRVIWPKGEYFFGDLRAEIASSFSETDKICGVSDEAISSP